MLRVLIFGGTGSAGRAVLQECLASALVGEVRAITRRQLGEPHDKLTTVLHNDYTHYDAVKTAFDGSTSAFTAWENPCRRSRTKPLIGA